jgi:hypothetical protein
VFNDGFVFTHHVINKKAASFNRAKIPLHRFMYIGVGNDIRLVQ